MSAAARRPSFAGLAARALALCLVAAVLLPASAAAAVPAEFVGTQWSKIPSARDFAAMRRGKVSVYRHNLVWAKVEPNRGRYNWKRYDGLMAQAARHRVRILPVLVGSPRWANPDIHHPPIRVDKKRAYYKYVGAVVKRYGAGGDFWRTQPESSRRYAARNFQIWNEPNLPNWWNDRVSPREYATMLIGAARAARAESTTAKIVAAGLPETRHPRVMSIRRFLTELYRQPGARDAFDYVAVHPYARTKNEVLNIVETARSTMNAAGDRSTKIFITEFGWATGGGHPDFSVTYSEQASLLYTTFREMIGRRNSLGIAGAFWYLLRDIPESASTTGGWQSRAGLRTRTGAPKPAWRALTDLTGGRP